MEQSLISMCGKKWQLTVILWTLGEGKSKNLCEHGKGKNTDGRPKTKTRRINSTGSSPSLTDAFLTWENLKPMVGQIFRKMFWHNSPQDKTQCIIEEFEVPGSLSVMISTKEWHILLNQTTLSLVIKCCHKDGVVMSKVKMTTMHLKDYLSFPASVFSCTVLVQELRIQNSLFLDKNRLIFIIFGILPHSKNF